MVEVDPYPVIEELHYLNNCVRMKLKDRNARTGISNCEDEHKCHVR